MAGNRSELDAMLDALQQGLVQILGCELEDDETFDDDDLFDADAEADASLRDGPLH